MVLSDLKRGESATVLGAEQGMRPALKEQFAALGIRAGEKVTVLCVSPRRQTFLIQAQSQVILAREAAREVRVCRT